MHSVTHYIQFIENTPIHSKTYRISSRQTEILKTEIDKILRHKIIEIGDLDCTSPMILVEVAGRDPRPYTDYRKLNKLTKTQFFSLPNTEQREETVAAAKYISVLHLRKGYWQIPLTPNSQRLVTFVTSFGTFRPLRMPFDLKNAPFTFSKITAEILHACEYFAVPYLGNVSIYCNSWEEHRNNMNGIFTKIKDAGLTIKPIKWKFAQDRFKSHCRSWYKNTL
ncbi:Transposon Ty3-G Gag-Pol polyprotein [Araneus ventricosus]|uniref:Transposon Ty3-G Gag-Pol polyprotein n=1 Tax=Araneus ventricosus TaxID=182803 RepID=A0A4Y2UV47_ARAVE|nr:Transposon Ty3-G Gag-Pol polyprotein [Araneus ventricosus]